MEWVSAIVVWGGTQMASKVFSKVIEVDNREARLMREIEKLQIQVRNFQNRNDTPPPEVDLTVSKAIGLSDAINTDIVVNSSNNNKNKKYIKKTKKRILYQEEDNEYICIYLKQGT